MEGKIWAESVPARARPSILRSLPRHPGQRPVEREERSRVVPTLSELNPYAYLWLRTTLRTGECWRNAETVGLPGDAVADGKEVSRL